VTSLSKEAQTAVGSLEDYNFYFNDCMQKFEKKRTSLVVKEIETIEKKLESIEEKLETITSKPKG